MKVTKSNYAIMDLAYTKSGKWLLCIYNLSNGAANYKIYDDIMQAELCSPAFITETDLTSVTELVVDCCISYLPKFIQSVEKKGIAIRRQRRLAHKIEPIIYPLIQGN